MNMTERDVTSCSLWKCIPSCAACCHASHCNRELSHDNISLHIYLMGRLLFVLLHVYVSPCIIVTVLIFCFPCSVLEVMASLYCIIAKRRHGDE